MNLILNHAYKPKRFLFYLEPSEQEKQDFFLGIMPDELMKFDGAFGTYDCPGLFKIISDDGEKEVLGIEFRPDDDRIDYPKNLKCTYLDAGFMVYALCTHDTVLNDKMISESAACICEANSNFPFHKLIKPNINSKLFQVFTLHNNTRIFIQANEVKVGNLIEELIPSTERENHLYDVAYHDWITGHNNWNFLQQIITAFGEKNIQDYCFAHFDIKAFNSINVIYGHNIANDFLTFVAEKLKNLDWIYYSCRCDNDNFAMMIKDMPEEELEQKLMAFFDSVSILPADCNFHVNFRCGVVPMQTALLLGNRVADASKLAQRLGNKLNKTEVIFYSHKIHDGMDWGTKLKAYLDTAIKNDEFLVYLQPKYDVSTEKIHGAEALIRWKYQNKELLSPAKFIPVFEKDGSISKIDDIVLEKVCSYLKKWKEQGLPLLPISVNLSRKRMSNPDLINHLTKIVDSFGVDHSLIDFELTESAVYDDQDYMIKVISELKERGFKISMDDFGTGYSSLSLLTIMPVDTLKIDKSFIDPIGNDSETYKEREVLKHIITMAKALNLTCLVEGAEEKSQVDRLREFGCELIQGYYFSKPLPVEEYEFRISSN